MKSGREGGREGQKNKGERTKEIPAGELKNMMSREEKKAELYTVRAGRAWTRAVMNLVDAHLLFKISHLSAEA